MALNKVVVTIPRKSGITADNVVNTFWITPESTLTIADVKNAVNRFYNGTGSPALPGDISYYLSDCLSRATNACTVSLTTVDQATGYQSGVATKDTWTLEDHASVGAGWTGSIPAEISPVATFHGDRTAEIGPGGIRPMSRRRGRVYLPPVGRLALYDDGTTGETTWASAFITAIKDAMVRFKSDWDAVSAPWVVYSRSTRVTTTVTGGWVNNNPDVQRRRGIKPSSKTGWGTGA